MPELYEDIREGKWSFGNNWKKFLEILTPQKIEIAKKSLKDFIGVADLKGKIFLDIGSGSGLFSLCAYKLGAEKVISVDVDKASVSCAQYLRQACNLGNREWVIHKGSVLNEDFMKSLPCADVVYSWGVLHHTGDMWNALRNVLIPLKENGLLYIAIYNRHTGFPDSCFWLRVKKFYSRNPLPMRITLKYAFITLMCMFKLLELKNPFRYISEYEVTSTRGMDFLSDVEDWLGGYPYEFASPSEITSFFESRGLKLIKCKEVNSIGCNEFLFSY